MRSLVKHTLPLAALVLVAGCLGGGGARPVDVPVEPANGPAADYPVVVGDPFTVDGVTYTPKDTMNFDAVGFAAAAPEGGAAVTAAHRTLPLPSYVEVTALDGGKTILVRIERRGPMAGTAQVELSPGAAAQLGYTGQPQFPVRVRRVNPTEPERALLRSGQPAPARMDTPKSLLVVLMRKLDTQEGVIRPVLAPVPVIAPKPEPSASPTPKAAVAPKPVVTPKSAVAAKPALAPKPPPTPRAAPAPKPAPTPKPATKPKPGATPTPTVKPTAAPTPRPVVPAAQGRFVIRVGTYGNKANADAAAKTVGGAATPSGKFWIVTMGPYAGDAQAQAGLAKARRAGYSDARIQRAN
jgi:rare lipoprotein A